MLQTTLCFVCSGCARALGRGSIWTGLARSLSPLLVVALPAGAAAATITWDGGSLSSNNFGDGPNWVGDIAPMGGDDLVFGGPIRPTPNNNLSPFSGAFTGLAFTGGADFTLTGNALAFDAGATVVPIENSAGSGNTLTLSSGILTASDLAVTASGGNITIGGTLTTFGGADLVLSGDDSRTINVSAAISGSGTDLSVSGPGAVTVNLTGTNSYNGTTSIASGTSLVVGGGGTLGSGPVSNDGALTFNTSGTSSVAAISGSGTMTQTGTGTTTLTGANTFTGATTINAGTLALGASGTLSGTSEIVLASGAILDVSATSLTLGAGQDLRGSGTVKGNASLGGTLTPGTAGGLGTLTVDGNLEGSATWLMDIAFGENYSATVDLVVITGDLNLSGASITFNDVGSTASGYPIVFAQYSGTLSGTFGSITAPAGYSIDYNYNGLNQIALIPEPSTVLPLAAMLVPFLMIRRRRKGPSPRS